MSRISISSRSDSGWPIILIVVTLGAFAVGITPTGSRVSKEFMESLSVSRDQPISLQKPDVLLIGDSPADQKNVATTIAPRGYNLILAENAAAGLDRIHSHANRIGMIVVDSRLAKLDDFQLEAQSLSPEVRVVTLQPKHTTSELVSLLLSNIQN